MNVLEWGVQLRFIFVVPAFASGNRHKLARQRGTGKLLIFPEPRVYAFKQHLRACFKAICAELRHRDELFRAIEFPLAGKEGQLRVDMLFGFRADEDGSHRRMKLSDIDNLRKTTQDALEGELFDNDRYIVEGYTSIGEAPPEAKGDVIWCCVSRAGYRTGRENEQLHLAPHFATIPPWRPTDRPGAARIERVSPIIVPGSNGGVPEKSN